jgi:hypothetical protein
VMVAGAGVGGGVDDQRCSSRGFISRRQGGMCWKKSQHRGSWRPPYTWAPCVAAPAPALLASTCRHAGGCPGDGGPPCSGPDLEPSWARGPQPAPRLQHALPATISTPSVFHRNRPCGNWLAGNALPHPISRFFRTCVPPACCPYRPRPPPARPSPPLCASAAGGVLRFFQGAGLGAFSRPLGGW